MRVHFTGITEPTRVAGVFRTPGEIANLRDDHAREAIRSGLAAPVGHASLRRPPGHTAMPKPYNHESQRPDFTQVTATAHSLGELRAYRNTSIIVPCFRSRKHIEALLDTMGAEHKSVVLVSDGDGIYTDHPQQIVLSANTGFAHACNLGARHTHSKYICFLNADTRVTPAWLDTMLDEINRDPRIGAVGNRQLDGRGRIHSCGSEWSWMTQSWEHVLRDQEPGNHKLWTQPREVDVITASCLLVRHDVFAQVGGFDERYLHGYWEGADLCMKIRQAGYQIRFTPESEIVHYCGHSGGCHHKHYQRNADLHKSRWIETGLVDKFKTQRGAKAHNGDVVACLIALNEAEYIGASIESVYPLADRIIVVEGGNDYAVAAEWCGPDKRSTDETIAAIHAVDDPDGKIELITGAWRDKTQQRNAYAERLKAGDIMLLLDADEVFYESGLWRLSYLLHKQDVIMPDFDLFWNDFSTCGTGRWRDFPQVKTVRWEEGHHYRDHNCPCDAQGRLVTATRKPYTTREKLYAHYAWVKPLKKLRAKAAYYERQPGAAPQMRRRYINTVFLPWRENPQEIEGQYGTHPFGGGGTEPFAGRHPAPIARRMTDGTFAWAEDLIHA